MIWTLTWLKVTALCDLFVAELFMGDMAVAELHIFRVML